jgi:maltooligosyltrehalose trehalohydrolase
MRLGADYLGNGRCKFLVWAPFLKELAVATKTESSGASIFPMRRDRKGYWKASLEGIQPGVLYFYRLGDGIDRPDPASHLQPLGVHGPSQIVDHTAYAWGDQGWRGISLSEMIIYELHIGTFTPEGTFKAVIPRLSELRGVGVNVIEIMPVAQFPGERNWGYDGVYPFAVQYSYGGPGGLKELVDACHQEGIGVILDVVYNHLGPEGNYLRDFGPYFTDRYKTPWGEAVNFDGPHSNEVRRYFIENAIHWYLNYHVDALRLDAIHAVFDFSANPFLSELSERVEKVSKEKGQRYALMAESDLNNSRMVESREMGGHGVDAQWCDDFHHSLHTILTGERQGYYVDFGKMGYLAKSLKNGFVYSGQYSAFRKRNHGNSSKDIPARKFVVCCQNHDQVGNRMLGERLTSLVSFESLKLAAGVVLCSPYIPLLFMGEEYGESTPFLYFVHHSDPALIESVRRGRNEEFKLFQLSGEPPDPQSKETFDRSKLEWKKRDSGNHRILLGYYKELIMLRREIPALSNLNKDQLDARSLESQRVLLVERWKDKSRAFFLFNLGPMERVLVDFIPEGRWKKRMDSSDSVWNGPGTILPERVSSKEEIRIRGYSFAMYLREEIS